MVKLTDTSSGFFPYHHTKTKNPSAPSTPWGAR